jgi:hypothetical protein
MKPNPLSNNWQAKLVCLFVAVVIWAYVKNLVQPGFIALVIWVYVKNLVQPGFIDQMLTGTFTPGK